MRLRIIIKIENKKIPIFDRTIDLKNVTKIGYLKLPNDVPLGKYNKSCTFDIYIKESRNEIGFVDDKYITDKNIDSFVAFYDTINTLYLEQPRNFCTTICTLNEKENITKIKIENNISPLLKDNI